MIEKAPPIKVDEILKLLIKEPSPDFALLIEKAIDNYEYWDTIKYRQTPSGYSALDLWKYVKAERLKQRINVWGKYGIHFSLTNSMQRQCHEFDMNFGGSWESDCIIPSNGKERYLVSSLMEEAISSSLMEGATTTRKIAKEMLRKKIAPKDRSQQMIYNNYQTIQFIVENKKEALTSDLLLEIHRLMTEKTLEKEEDAGCFRKNDDVVVEDGITHEIVHIPPSFKEIPEFINDFCTFFNEEKPKEFIHPVIRGIILHFMLAYMHPFVDGNGRTARAIFYWYMLKQGYWLTEYLSISRIIYRAKKSYEKSFLYAEADNNDIGYFIAHNLRVLDLAFKDLQRYINRKTQERKIAASFLQLDNVNERQAEIIKIYNDNPKEMLTVKDLQTRFMITPTTAKKDILGLMQLGMLSEISFNKVKKGYIKGDLFDEKVKAIKD